MRCVREGTLYLTAVIPSVHLSRELRGDLEGWLQGQTRWTDGVREICSNGVYEPTLFNP